jgi:hypothetical protein
MQTQLASMNFVEDVPFDVQDPHDPFAAGVATQPSFAGELATDSIAAGDPEAGLTWPSQITHTELEAQHGFHTISPDGSKGACCGSCAGGGSCEGGCSGSCNGHGEDPDPYPPWWENEEEPPYPDGDPPPPGHDQFGDEGWPDCYGIVCCDGTSYLICGSPPGSIPYEEICKCPDGTPQKYEEPCCPEQDLCGPDITDQIIWHLNIFLGQDATTPPGWSPHLGAASRYRDLVRGRPGGGWGVGIGHNGAFGDAVDLSNTNSDDQCGKGACAGTVTLCDMCISTYHIDHIFMMAYLTLTQGAQRARLLGRLNEIGGEGTPDSNADLAFNDVAISMARTAIHGSIGPFGNTVYFNRENVCDKVSGVGRATRQRIAQKPSKAFPSKRGYGDCPPCPRKINRPPEHSVPRFFLSGAHKWESRQPPDWALRRPSG